VGWCNRIRSPRRCRHLTAEFQQFAMQRIIPLSAQVIELLELQAELALPPQEEGGQRRCDNG
jgi:hypothetical protein